jgi:hypothetical protein
MEEEEHVELQYCEQQHKRIQELREKTKSTMRGMLYWDENAWPERTYIDQYEVGHYEPKIENTSTQNIGQIRLLVGKYKKIEVVVNTNRFVAQKAPMKIENVLLHPQVMGPTRASKAHNSLKPENALNWWGIHGEENPLMYGMKNVNAVLKNKYSSRLPGYLSIRSDYTKLTRYHVPRRIYVTQVMEKNIACTWHSSITFAPQNRCTSLRQKNVANVKLARTFVSLYAHILKNVYLIPEQPYILLPANIYCLILLIATKN